MNVKNWQLKTFTQPIMVAFFMLLGYLEAGVLGVFAGLVLYGIAVLTIFTSLVPFAGFFIWQYDFNFLANNLGTYLPITDLSYKIIWLVGTISIVFCFITSALTVFGIGLLIRYLINKRKKKITVGENIIDALVKLIPANIMGVLKGINFNDLSSIIQKIIAEIETLWSKLNFKIIGSATVFTGIGIASHDFLWESEVHESGMSRPTHGAYIGLQIAIGGMHMTVSNFPMFEQIRKCMLAYLGMVICYISFFTMQFIPRGIARVVNHFFWWVGIALIVYNWYNIMGTDIQNAYKVKMAKSLKK